MRVSLGQAAPPGPSTCRFPPGDPTCTRRKAAPQDRGATGEKLPAPSQLDLDVKETDRDTSGSALLVSFARALQSIP